MTVSDWRKHYRDTFAGRDTRLAFRNRVTGEIRVVPAEARGAFQSTWDPDTWHQPAWEQIDINTVPKEIKEQQQ
jgi:hypothetical protein